MNERRQGIGQLARESSGDSVTMQRYLRALAVNTRGQITQEVQGNGVVTDRAFDPESGIIDVIDLVGHLASASPWVLRLSPPIFCRIRRFWAKCGPERAF